MFDDRYDQDGADDVVVGLGHGLAALNGASGADGVGLDPVGDGGRDGEESRGEEDNGNDTGEHVDY